MTSITNKGNYRTLSRSSPGELCSDDDDEYCEIVPRFCSDQWGKIACGPAISRGGNHGSLVYSVDSFAVVSILNVPYPLVLKMYPIRINENEMTFINTLFNVGANGSKSSTHEYGACNLVPYLVPPLAIAVINGVERGILMARKDMSLKEFLLSIKRPRGEYNGRTVFEYASDMSDGMEKIYEHFEESSFRGRKDFPPIRSWKVVAAIAFQLIVAIAYLNEELPHVVNGVQCNGFAHNDIHLDNLLLQVSTGRVALCDFELVSSIGRGKDADMLPHPPERRRPPLCRCSPDGLFCRTADTWGVGLVVISLLTGIDPIFDDQRILDDFGKGPLLRPWGLVNDPASVLDWEGNIKSYVRSVISNDDPTGLRLEEVEPLLSLCGRCLVNRADAEACSPLDLIADPVFSEFQNSIEVTDKIIKSWVDKNNGQRTSNI